MFTGRSFECSDDSAFDDAGSQTRLTHRPLVSRQPTDAGPTPSCPRGNKTFPACFKLLLYYLSGSWPRGQCKTPCIGTQPDWVILSSSPEYPLSLCHSQAQGSSDGELSTAKKHLKGFATAALEPIPFGQASAVRCQELCSPSLIWFPVP